jgi:amino acid adenylation domain-containing protein
LSKIVERSQHESAGTKKAGNRAFLCLGDLLAFYGRTAPRRNAILAPGCAPVTYAELWARTDDAVRELRRLGIDQSDRVAVVLPRGAESAVAMIAVATAAVCVPLNPDFTADELHRYFGDLRIAALLTRADMNSASRGVAQTLGIPVIDLLPRLGEGPGAFNLVGSARRRAVTGDLAPSANDAFILLTSGTTSRPKMIPLTHASVCLSAYNAGAALALGPRDRLLNVLPLFHAHGLISGLLAALAAGSSVICTPGFDAASFFGWLSELRPTWYTAVPTIHRALLSTADLHKHRVQTSSLRLIRSASASLPPDVLNGLESLFGVPVIETYGMTEAASQIAANPRERRKTGSVGQPAGPEVAIMDHQGQRLPAGECGEIVLRGPTITRGYDNDIAATESAFRNGWFRTGDLGYADPDGYLFIVGRIKDVINRGGQKVSPAEVEQALLSHPDVLEAGAFAIPHKRLGENVAAVVVLRPNTKVSTHKLRDFARKRLAGYKVPGLIRIVPEIPKGASGKIKRSALPDMLLTTTPTAEGNAKTFPPRSELKSQLANMWSDLLELSQVGVDQDVFALGADSLTVTQMLSRLRGRFGVNFSFEDIFDAPTVAAIAARLESSKWDHAAVSPTLSASPTDTRSVPLSFQQRRIYVLNGLDPTKYNYNVVEVARLCGPLDLEALEASITTICKRHEILRSTFSERLGEPVQTVGEIWPHLEHLDLGPCAENRRTAAIRRQAKKSARQSFKIEHEPPLQAQLLRLDEDDHALVIKVHHLATDGWSQRLFWEELEAHYSASKNGTAAELPELAFQYRNFPEWQRAWLQTQAAKEQLNYWRAQLEGFTELPLRTDRPRPKMWTGGGARYPFRLSRALSDGLKALSRTQSVTLFMTLLGAFQCLLYRYTNHDDVAVGSLIANRNQIQIERLIGMFANTIVLRTDVSGDPTFSEVLRRVRQVTLDAYRNQDLPIEEILQVLHVSRSLDRNPLFQVMFILQNASVGPPTIPGLSMDFLDVDPGIARFDLTLELADLDEHLTGWLEYSTDLFDAATIARMATHLRTLLEAIVANPEEPISRLPLLPESERSSVLTQWNGPQTNFGRLGNFSERFARRLKRAPEAAAVSAGKVRLSYRELARRSSAITHRLALEAIGPDVVVALLAERDADLLAAIIAVQRVGGAFLCLEPTLPAARLAQIVRSSGAPLLLAGQSSAEVLGEVLSRIPARERMRVLMLEDIVEVAPPDTHRPARPSPKSLASLVYTSGSTGVPKGVMIEQRGLLNHLVSLISELKLSTADVIAQTAPQSFVISVWQFLAGLMVGARLHICADETVRDPALLAQEVSREGLTVLQIVPSLLREILERTINEPVFRALGRLRLLISTGEPLPSALCREWFRHFPDVALINAYGSSECSDDVALHRLTTAPTPFASVPVGRAIPNTRLYVLDSNSQPVPIGVAGELCVGGIGVGRGYLNDPEQTKQRFFRDPFSNRREARLYRTGDLARWRADGTLECLGRIDQQVKLRGYRIELKEIEHVLLEHPDVRGATVLQRDDIGSETRLVAHIVTAASRQPKANDLREFLKVRLPSYMIPRGFIFLERMPLTAHGKVDRSALLAIRQGVTIVGDTLVAPRHFTEKVLSDIWMDLLKIEGIGVFDNFFDLGGHSLLAGQIMSRVANAFGVSLPIRAVFEAPTIEALAKRIDEARETQSYKPALEITRLEENGPQPVSVAQDQMVRIERNLPGLPQFNLPFAFRLKGPLNVPALNWSLVEVMRAHEALRTGFAWVKEQPVALIAEPGDIVSSLVVEDAAAWKTTASKRARTLRLKKLELQSEQEAWTPFNIARAPLLRTRLLRLGADDHVLLMTMHHVIADGWSIGILFEEISKLYSAFIGGRQDPLPKPTLQFSDVARWQRWWCTTDAAAQQLAYWKENLRGASPVFRTDGGVVGARLSSRSAHEPVHLREDLIARLSAFSRTRGATLFMTLLTGLKAVLLARTGRKDICVATAMANRSQPSTNRVIGPFENTTIIRTSMDPNLPFQEALDRVRDAVLEAHARQELPFEILSARLAKEDGLDPASLIQVYFTLQNPLRQPLELPDIAAQSFRNVYREGQPVLPIDHTWLSLMLKERPSGITGSCSYKSNLFKPGAVTHLMEDFTMILANAVANPELPLRRSLDC